MIEEGFVNFSNKALADKIMNNLKRILPHSQKSKNTLIIIISYIFK